MRYCPVCEKRYKENVKLCPVDRTRTVVLRSTGEAQFRGRVLDERWLIEDRLRKGGMGEIYLGRQLSIERQVAIKLMRENFTEEQQLMARFFREAKALSSLHHPNIVTMFDFGQDEETRSLYMVMEFLRGYSMAEHIESNAEDFSLVSILQVMSQLASALVEVHAQGVIHRDLKPENLFLEENSDGFHLKLIDFGIAMLEEPVLTRLTETGQIQGTPHYMAPEQIEGGEATPRTDLYAFGLILYELLASRTPFPGETMIDVLQQQLCVEPEPLASVWAINEPVHKPLVELVEQLIAKDPENRPEDALYVLGRLKTFLKAMPDSGAVVSPSEVLGEPSVAIAVNQDTPLKMSLPLPTNPPIELHSVMPIHRSDKVSDSLESWMIPESVNSNFQRTPVLQLAVAAAIALVTLGLLLVWANSDSTVPTEQVKTGASTVVATSEVATTAVEVETPEVEEPVAAPTPEEEVVAAPSAEEEPAEPVKVEADKEPKAVAKALDKPTRKRTSTVARQPRAERKGDLQKILNDMRSP